MKPGSWTLATNRATTRILAVAAYYGLMTTWLYWIDAGHGNNWWEAIPLALAQLAIGFAIGRWWAALVPLALPLIAAPAGYPESEHSEPPPLWFIAAYAAALAIPFVLLGVVARKRTGGVRWVRSRLPSLWSSHQ